MTKEENEEISNTEEAAKPQVHKEDHALSPVNLIAHEVHALTASKLNQALNRRVASSVRLSWTLGRR